MTEIEESLQESSVQERLLKAAFDLFLHENYNKVTTRMLATKAKTSLSMIRYHFGDKQKLYEEMVRQQFNTITQALEDSYSEDKGLDFELLLMKYLDIHNEHPDFSAFFNNILSSKNGPGYLLFSQILDAKRERIEKLVRASQESELLGAHVDIDVLRILIMSLTVFPILIQGILANSTTFSMSDQLFEKVAHTAGRMLTSYVIAE
ncbi:MAG: TetR/AcrR family transcriptional regulator [Oleispira sp.]